MNPNATKGRAIKSPGAGRRIQSPPAMHGARGRMALPIARRTMEIGTARARATIRAARRRKATAYNELARDEEASKLFSALDRALPQIFNNSFVRSIDRQTWEKIKVMFWNGYFSPEEAVNFLRSFNQNTRTQGIPRDIPAQVFFMKTVGLVVKKRQKEWEKKQIIETVFP